MLLYVIQFELHIKAYILVKQFTVCSHNCTWGPCLFPNNNSSFTSFDPFSIQWYISTLSLYLLWKDELHTMKLIPYSTAKQQWEINLYLITNSWNTEPSGADEIKQWSRGTVSPVDPEVQYKLINSCRNGKKSNLTCWKWFNFDLTHVPSWVSVRKYSGIVLTGLEINDGHGQT